MMFGITYSGRYVMIWIFYCDLYLISRVKLVFLYINKQFGYATAAAF